MRVLCSMGAAGMNENGFTLVRIMVQALKLLQPSLVLLELFSSYSYKRKPLEGV